MPSIVRLLIGFLVQLSYIVVERASKYVKVKLKFLEIVHFCNCYFALKLRLECPFDKILHSSRPRIRFAFLADTTIQSW